MPTEGVKFRNKLESLVEKYIPVKTLGKRQKLPYFNKYPEKLNRKLNKHYKRRNSSPRANKHYKSLKAFFQKELRKAYWRYIENIFSGDNTAPTSDLKENKAKTSKQFWYFIKNRRNDNTGVSLLRENGQLVSDSQQKAEILNSLVASLLRKTHHLLNLAIAHTNLLTVLKSLRQGF